MPDDHPNLQSARHNLAATRAALGDFAGARTAYEQVLAHLERTRPDDDPELCRIRCDCAAALWHLGDRPAFVRPVERLAGGLRAQAQTGWLLSQRERLERLQTLDGKLSRLLSLAGAVPDARELPLGVFAAVEELRDLSGALGVAPTASGDPELASLAEKRRELRARLAAYSGRSGSRAELEQELAALVRERDEVDSRIARRCAALGVEAPRIEPAALGKTLGSAASAVGLRSYQSVDLDGARNPVRSLLAHVVKADGSLARVELGAWEPIGAAVERWRGAIGSPLGARGLAVAGRASSADEERAAGAELARLVLAPILAAAGDEQELHVCLDDALHLVPLDALPFEGKLFGERVVVHTELSFGRLLAARREISAEPCLVALGGVDYDAEVDATQPAALLALAAAPVEPLDRGGGASAWSFLPGTLDEARGIAARFRAVFQREPRALTGPAASKAALFEAVQGARFVHLATHGWYAPESVRSILDPVAGAAPLPLTNAAAQNPAQLGLWTAESAGARVLGMAPMTLCGLALAGANRGPDADGRSDGILTAEELAALDLAQCELAVLSACETNVGRTRAGQAVQSLQAALHAAGARTAITSLWKVDDAATRELFEDFYARIWVAKEPKARALWNAKMQLRAAGHPTRDWAGWVLTGEPD